jgi:hypothetical protein
MANQPLGSRSNGDTGDTAAGPAPERPPSTPRWVKVSAVIGIVLVLLVAIMTCTGIAGEHGPGRHPPSGGADDHKPPLLHGVQQP